jgi:hypothetical protein
MKIILKRINKRIFFFKEHKKKKLIISFTSSINIKQCNILFFSLFIFINNIVCFYMKKFAIDRHQTSTKKQEYMLEDDFFFSFFFDIQEMHSLNKVINRRYKKKDRKKNINL